MISDDSKTKNAENSTGDVSHLKEQLQNERHFSETLIRTMSDPVILLDENNLILYASPSFKELFKENGNLRGKSIYETREKQFDFEDFRDFLSRSFAEGSALTKSSINKEFRHIGNKNLLINGQRFKYQGSTEALMLIFKDVTSRVDAEEELAEVNYKFEELVHSSPWLITILKGPDHIVEIANDAILEVWNKDRSIEGLPLGQVLPEIEVQGFLELLTQVYETGEAYEAFEVPAYHIRNGKRDTIYVDFIYQPQRNLDGKITGVAVIATDVTKQVELNKEINKSQETFRELAELIPTKINATDISGTTEYANKSWKEYSGLNLEGTGKEVWESLVHPEDINTFRSLFAISSSINNDFEMEARLKDADGKYHWHLSKVVPIKDDTGRALKWIGSHTLIQKIKEEEKRKENFLKLVSHELKTPVTSIKGYTQMMLKMVAEDQDQMIASAPLTKSLKRVDNQLDRLTRLISELLDISRIDDSAMSLNVIKFKLNKLVDAAVDDILQSYNDVSIEIAHEKQIAVEADKDRILQVLLNLMVNAIKYSENEIDITVRIYEPDESHAAIAVTDRGIGILEKDLNPIFDRFYRVSGKNEGTYSGFGIGLFLAKEIVEKHHGKILVNSKLGQGSTFTVVIPKTQKLGI